MMARGDDGREVFEENKDRYDWLDRLGEVCGKCRWIPDDEPDLDWFNRPRNPSNPDPDGFDQRPTWRPEEISLGDGRILVLEDS